MIGKENRFHGHHAVSRVRGQSIHGRFFSLRMAGQRGESSPYRLAVVVSKKIANKAVVRNRIRRRTYEIIRTQLNLEDKHIDIILYAKTAEIAFVEVDLLKKDILTLFHRGEQSLRADRPKYRS
ncbi:MAG TPA: ribonuclease P protein component [Candidatus Saccharibacteria bacterium]|jgi:ribonuclease P protein component|nr:ribonuclease P protein component [Candidatus Saccharibacteria bacterium]HMT56140.1 ribonuclease P protein component [Candidatus Saccharibacteria bacterium]